MIVAFLLIFLELGSILVYADLWLVLRYKKHVFDPLLALISEK